MAVDVVVVSYNSGEHLRECVAPLALLEGVNVVVVDNASDDGCLESVADLAVERVELTANVGFASGCNAGARWGSAPAILFLNPDARIDEASLRRLEQALGRDPGVAAAAPKIVGGDGRVEYSQRRFPALRSTFARAFFLHRVAPGLDELVRDPSAYDEPGSPDWVSGACLLVRRTAFESVGGFDESFFLYGEDIDLARRLRDSGFDLRFEPDASAVHAGGGSAPRPRLLPLLVASRLRYLRKHHGLAVRSLARVGIALGECTHIVVSRGGVAQRLGHARALRAAASTGSRS
jgi:N-acetylglucosaminyl-diphospho-decaprenol L-rhamnosyltransferase